MYGASLKRSGTRDTRMNIKARDHALSHSVTHSQSSWMTIHHKPTPDVSLQGQIGESVFIVLSLSGTNN